MNNEKYFVIKSNEDGDIGIYEHTEKNVLEMLKKYEDSLPTVITNLEDKNDPMFWGNSILIIKGKIIVPKPKETVKSWGIE